MADILNLKINERSNVERPNLRDQLQNLLIFGILIAFQIENILKIC